MYTFNIESKTVADFWGLYNRDELILRPEYQRKIVWPQEAKESLMESILKGYPIPEIYLEYSTDADGNQTVAVVDGQQRLSALLEFLSNKYSLKTLDDPNFADKKFEELPEEVRTKFFQYTFPIRKLLNLEDETVREIFARVNRVNMTLTPQELRNARMPGPFMDFLIDCVNHPLNETAGLFSVTRKLRGGDLEYYAELFGACTFGIPNKKANLDERYDVLSENFDDYADRAEQFLDTLGLIESTVSWTPRTRWSNIIDMYSLVIAFFDDLEVMKRLATDSPEELTSSLDIFQAAVSERKKDDGDTKLRLLADHLDASVEETLKFVDTYQAGIRNSSDLGARRSRDAALKELISLTDRK